MLPQEEPTAPEENKLYILSPQEKIILEQRNRQNQGMELMSGNFEQWNQEDAIISRKLIIASNFNQDENYDEDWEVTDFLQSASLESIGMVVKTPFKPLPRLSELNLSGQLIKSNNVVSLRSLGIEINVHVTLSGTSTLWIITRANKLTDESAAICQFRKEEYTYRAFWIFAGAMGDKKELKFFKKQEIADVDPVPNEDKLKLVISYVDNGDQRIIVKCGHSKRQIGMSSDLAVPISHDTPIMLGGTGQGVVVDHIRVKQTPRQVDLTHVAVSSCEKCCVLF